MPDEEPRFTGRDEPPGEADDLAVDVPRADDPPRALKGAPSGYRTPEETDDPLDHGSPPDPDAPTDRVWRGNTLREPSPGD